MDDMQEVEVRVLRDVIETVENRLRCHEAAGGYVLAPRAEVYAELIFAVITSARSAGHYGAGSLVRAPILDVILGGVETGPWEAAVYAMIMDGALISG
ncbi:hypothetical protein [Nocardia seriolae]|uniref:Uncharacterized protein n=1 Tax=Nocardia seriolae TaxID=37332 RepID=A0A0B8N7V4_9NOCA|nr:hypothetical protein [Nocardia seriolae]APA98336.1 hypothetical protein NS506_04288 [Nocardia seriolae]MTJ63009.1 hypothetical protein [Nocardia seriolae]MTJ75631.1 hypothetical protein [Nocardia seriolae]MTJ88035.1 hypothetical protein [Nocardia seriolae]MTK32024.1 hypothetical protein [Nocardia seriolae]